MSTTTIRLSEELKERVAAAAASTGTTAHSFIVEAVQQRVAQAEARAAFMQEALARLHEMNATGQHLDFDDMREALLARARGEDVAAPKVKTLSPRERKALARPGR